jgi:hypothetical protein
MSKEEDSAELIMRLYELRREEKMREGRTWFVMFQPESAQDIMNAMIDPKSSAYYRMVLSYWEMAAGFVNRGAIDEEMFLDSNGESLMIFAKIEPYLDDLRGILGNQGYCKHLETLALKQPEGRQGMADRRDFLKKILKERAAMAEGAK